MNLAAVGLGLIALGATLAIGDYVVTHGANPPGAFGTLVTNIDDLDGLLSGLAPALGTGTLLVIAGVIVMVNL